MAKIQAFENYREEYEKWFDENKYTYLTEVAAIKKLLPQNGNGIEIGIGTGKFAEPLGIKVGVEPSQQMGELAKKRGIKIYKNTAENLPIPNDSYDFVLMVTAICFVDDVLKTFQEIYRILKFSGVVLIAFVDKNSPIGKTYVKHQTKDKFYKEATFFSTEEVLNYLKKTGFKNFEIHQTVFGKTKDIQTIQTPKSGSGEGSFVIIKAKKGE